MIDQLISSFTDVDKLLENEFFSGGLAIGVLGAVLAYVRYVPRGLWNLFRRKYITTIEIRHPDLRPVLGMWLEENSQYIFNRKNLLATLHHRPKEDEDDNSDVLGFEPGYGRHFLRVPEFGWITLFREREEGGNESGASTIHSLLREDVYTISYLGRSSTAFLEFFSRIIEETKTRETGPRVYLSQTDWWKMSRTSPRRSMDTISLAGTLKEDLLEQVGGFLSSRQWYEARGIPWSVGFLFQGPPGSGKTTTVQALASHFGLRLYVVDLSNKERTDSELIELISEVPSRSVLLFEDVDRVFDSTEERATTLSGILNAIGGVVGSHGRIVIMTANHPEKLDDALVRDRRIDRKITFGPATGKQARETFLRFFPGEEELAAGFEARVNNCESELSVSKLENHLLAYRNSPQMALEKEWV